MEEDNADEEENGDDDTVIDGGDDTTTPPDTDTPVVNSSRFSVTEDKKLSRTDKILKFNDCLVEN